jgi:23S rRNA pseudouridine2605 synthase
MEQRINRILSRAGLVSRRKADEIIRAGRVMLKGNIVRELGVKAHWGKDSIKLDGKEIPGPSERTYLLLNKPFGYISSLNDPQGRPVVTDLIKDVPHRVYPVGRLDFDSLGLLLLTNDGDLSHGLTHPRYRVPKTYKVTVEGKVSKETLNKLRNGIELEDGFSNTARAALVKQSGGRSVLRITVYQGRNRLVRRMVEAVGHKAIQLIRTGFGSLELGSLKIGEYRHLEPDEINDLKRMVKMK